MRVPYVRAHTKSFTTVTSVDHQVRLNRFAGSRLLNIYSCLFAASNTGLLAQDLDNSALTRETSFQSRMNQNYLQDYRLDNTDGDDYEQLKAHGLLCKSAVSTADVYRFNKIWVDSWRSGSMVQWPNRDDMVDGYSLDEECVYVMNKTVASGSYRHQLHVVTQREIKVSPGNGVTIN